MYQPEHIKKIITELLKENVSPDIWNWLNDNTYPASSSTFNTAFVAMPRKTGKGIISANSIASKEFPEDGIQWKEWTTDRLARVWLLMNLDASDQEKYLRNIENLFITAEVNELIALYSALPVFSYPEYWTRRCAEGIRNNISGVLEAIMCNNPYPAAYLKDAAWNQLVLKAFFTEKPIHRIIGLDQRANQELAYTLVDYAHERWAAGRLVNPQLWRCVGPFIDAVIFPDIIWLANAENRLENQAAALACSNSNYPPATELFNQNSELKNAVLSGYINWETIAADLEEKNDLKEFSK
jgi:hypothetical protein